MDTAINSIDIDRLPEFAGAVALPGFSDGTALGGAVSGDAATIVAVIVYGISEA